MRIKLTGSIVLVLALVHLDCFLAQDSRQNRAVISRTTGNNNNNPNGRVKTHFSNETCGLPMNLASRVEKCAKPLTDILQGTLDKWPKNEGDIIELCHMFEESERCIRDTARRCASGLQKIVISTLANSVQRTRKRECLKQKYPALLKTTKCVENNQQVPQLLIANATSRLEIIETQIKNLDGKTTAICCMIGEIEGEMKRNLGRICPDEAKVMVRLYRSVIEDVNQIICRSFRSTDWTKGYKIPPIVPSNFEGIIAILMRIIFSLSE